SARAHARSNDRPIEGREVERGALPVEAPDAMPQKIVERRPIHELRAVELTDDDIVDATGRRSDRVRAAAEALLAAAGNDQRLPILPETASEAIRLANDPTTPMNKLERVVARDTVLTSRMLMVAGSAAYAGSSVRTLSGALQRMGSGTVRDLLYQSVMECHVFSDSDRAWARDERDHAVAVASIARIVCSMVGVDAELAFVCGLLHDLGRVALRSLRAVEIDPTVRADAEQLAHSRLGARIAAHWKLPPLVAEAVRRHHGWRGFGPKRDGYSQIGHIVAVADVVSTHLGHGRPPRALDDKALATIHAMGIDPPQLVARARDDVSAAAA
ncbi:MAG TPA: HDOD domain-containing protein, partial [Nannocystaceae bacterium]|nr:HDOD domain-containing protein [Nannocystaceae bacterium]